MDPPPTLLLRPTGTPEPKGNYFSHFKYEINKVVYSTIEVRVSMGLSWLSSVSSVLEFEHKVKT